MRPTFSALVEVQVLEDLHPGQKVYVDVDEFAWHGGSLYVLQSALTHKIPRGDDWQVINDQEGIFVVASSMRAAHLVQLSELDEITDEWVPVARIV